MDISPQHPGPRLHPLTPAARSWRRLRRRPAVMQARTVVVIVAVVVGLVLWLVMAPSGAPGGSAPAGALEVAESAYTPTPVGQASTSTRGVTSSTINVAFPVVDINSLAGKFGFAQDKEFGEQINAIHLYVNQINQSGGINGRKINPIIDTFDPANDANMQALCDQWTQGSPGVFAVLDGIGTWEGDQQLCVTQQGHTPLISAWSTVSDWTQLGSPYLWWTGADDVPVFKALIKWGLASGRLSKSKKIGVVVSDQAADQAALNYYLLPDLKKVGIVPQVDVIAGNAEDTASTNTDAQQAVEKLKSAGVQSVIPLIPENAFFPYIGQENAQKYYPQLLLSDYQSTVEIALGLIPVPYETALNGQEGVTTETLGNNVDDNRPESQGGYVPGVRSCYNTWHAAHPGPIPGSSPPTHFIEEQGPIQAWCGAIRLFATAAKAAGKNLNRRTFVEAMSKVTNFQGTLSPVWSFSPTKMYGPTEYQVVQVHNNVPPSSACQLTTFHKAQGTCWVVKQSWQPLPS